MAGFTHIAVRPRSRLLGLVDLDAVASSLAAGGLAVLPTETGYMLAAVASNLTAVEAAFAVKGRAHTAVMHVACSSLVMARRFASLDDRATNLLGRFTPGPLSVVVPTTGTLPEGLVTRGAEMGIRVPEHPATLQVIAAVGEPLTATSLNPSGGAPTPLDDLASLNWPEQARVFVVVDEEAVAYDRPSTLVRLTGPEVEMLRPGPVTLDEVRARLEG